MKEMILDDVFAFSGDSMGCAWVGSRRIRERADFFLGNKCSIVKVENVLDVRRLFLDRRWADVWSCLVSRFWLCGLHTSTGLAGTGGHRLFDNLGQRMEDECVVMEGS